MSIPTSFELTISPASGVAPLPVTFTITGLTQEVSRVLIRYGDGLESNEVVSTHTYRAAGLYSVYVTVWFSNASSTSYTYTDAVEVFEWDIVHTGLDGSVTDTSYCYAVDRTQGEGFSKNTGSAWPRVEAEVGLQLITDNLDNYHLLAWDSVDGFAYDLTTRTGALGSGLVEYNKDKVAVGGTPGTGTDIVPLVKFPNDTGTYEHHALEALGHFIEIRPATESTRGDSGYDANGFLDSTLVDISQFTDGEQTTAQVDALDITPPKYEAGMERRKVGHRHSLQISVNKGENTIVGRVSRYVAKDIPEDPDTRRSTEADWQLYVNQNLLLWLSRGATLLKDLISGSTIAGTVTAITGPDGKSNSAMRNASPITIYTPAIGATGYILAWFKGGQQITGANAFTPIGATTSGSWRFGYVAGPFASGLILPAGDWYSVRVFSDVGSINAATHTYLYNDITANAGRNTENPW